MHHDPGTQPEQFQRSKQDLEKLFKEIHWAHRCSRTNKLQIEKQYFKDINEVSLL